MDCDAAGGCPEDGDGTENSFPDVALDDNAPKEIQGSAPSEEIDAQSLEE
jgi:hypothetical protein